MRRVLIPLILFLLLAPLPGSQLPRPPANTSNVLTAAADGAVAPGTRFGALTLTEAWELRSANSRFGGMSGLAQTGPRQFHLVSDAGYTLSFDLSVRGGVSRARLRDLPPLRPGLDRKRFLDAEAVAIDPVTNRRWVALEGIAQIWRMAPGGSREARLRNPFLFRWSANGGAESLARMPDGAFIALSERTVDGDLREGVRFSGDPAAVPTQFFRFRYDDGGLGAPTDAAALPDGRLLILHRKLGLAPVFTSRIAIADPRGIARGGLLTSRLIGTIADARLAENYEGMAVEAGPGGALALWLVSDDNQNDWQRTRLVRFALDPAALDPATL
jgi:hypothetical protein